MRSKLGEERDLYFSTSDEVAIGGVNGRGIPNGVGMGWLGGVRSWFMVGCGAMMGSGSGVVIFREGGGWNDIRVFVARVRREGAFD